jgi:hypothetical protein
MKTILLHFFTRSLRVLRRRIGNIPVRALFIPGFIILSCETQEHATPPITDSRAVFHAFSANGQTLPTAINALKKQVRLEVNHNVDVTRLVPEFDIPDGYKVFVNGVLQTSGNSVMDLSSPVTYELRDKSNRSTAWEVSAVPLSCKILIDASHDGGVWWAPQWEGTGFNPDAWHQGKPFADSLRAKGFEVAELGRGVELKDEMFFGYYIVIRASGFFPYTADELKVYSRLLDRGMNLAFFTDHKKHDPVDELGDLLGLKFEGIAEGMVTTFAPHEITTNLDPFCYAVGSELTNAHQNSNIEVLGWLEPGHCGHAGGEGTVPVMGILHHPNSRIFFMGDQNSFQFQPQPFIDNLVHWMGSCFEH